MKTELKLDRNMRLIGISKLGHQTFFDTVPEVGGENSAPSPMEVMLQSLAACSSMDVLSILRKKRKQIDDFWVNLSAERAENHPKVFTKVHMIYNLKSSDAELKDLERAIELSHEKYCSVSAMFKAAGCIVTHESNIIK
ncbi:OsmC family peroxiredoxin [Bacteroidetes/Chlorobi group bacterium ChocPot_Mid]|jgi:putative redox protein|nr:MAG: OsmC family peroxiredoxin [Bacteroidetes/Chlorobi group bacterium ChocPot_Mid]